MSTRALPGDRHPEPTGSPLRVLIADDGSEPASTAMSLGFRIAGRTHGEVLLLHVESHRAARDYWQRHLDAAASYSPAHATTRTSVDFGDPAEMILEVARSEQADVICLGSTGAGGALGAVLGSVSAKVVNGARCPVVVCREGVRASPSHVSALVLGLDGSADALAALPTAERLAEIFDAALVLLTSYTVLAPSTAERRHGFKQRALGIMEEARERLTTDATVVEEVAQGPPREVLLDAVHRHTPAILVLGRTGLGGIKERLLGSTTSAMLTTARCPIVVVP